MKTLVLANRQSAGKTTISILLAHHLVRNQHRVLAIDLDQRGHFGAALQRSGGVTIAPFLSESMFTGKATSTPAERFVLVPAGPGLAGLEPDEGRHSLFANNARRFLQSLTAQFDVCIIDTHPDPDIRLMSALASANQVLCPIQANQEATKGIYDLLNHPRAGLKIMKPALNPGLQLIGVLPNLLEKTPYQRANLTETISCYQALLFKGGDGRFTGLKRNDVISQVQATGKVPWEMAGAEPLGAARMAHPVLSRLTTLMTGHRGAG